MSFKDFVSDALTYVGDKIASIPYRAIGRKIIRFIGDLLHRTLFTVLLPKKYRSLSKLEIYSIIFKSDTPAGKKFDIWLLVLIGANIVTIERGDTIIDMPEKTEIMMPADVLTVIGTEEQVSAIRADAKLSSMQVYLFTADVEFKDTYAEKGFSGVLIKPATLDSLKGACIAANEASSSPR